MSIAFAFPDHGLTPFLPIPALRRCHYCDLDYSVIGKLETLSEDLEYAALEAGLADVMPPSESGSFRMHSTRPRGGDPGTDRVPRYMAQLSEAQRGGLLRLYQLDFQLFDYRPDEFP